MNLLKAEQKSDAYAAVNPQQLLPALVLGDGVTLTQSLAIMEYLMSVDACICGDIVKELPLAQPTVSQHLKELKNAGLIKGSIEGNAICYCIDEKALQTLQSYFAGIAGSLLKKKTCC